MDIGRGVCWLSAQLVPARVQYRTAKGAVESLFNGCSKPVQSRFKAGLAQLSVRPARIRWSRSFQFDGPGQPDQGNQQNEDDGLGVEHIIGRQHESLLIHHPVDLRQRLLAAHASR